jgi:hypothetical protein
MVLGCTSHGWRLASTAIPPLLHSLPQLLSGRREAAMQISYTLLIDMPHPELASPQPKKGKKKKKKKKKEKKRKRKRKRNGGKPIRINHAI